MNAAFYDVSVICLTCGKQNSLRTDSGADHLRFQCSECHAPLGTLQLDGKPDTNESEDGRGMPAVGAILR